MNTSNMPKEKSFITNRIEPDDVLFGRGTGPNTNPGNKVFRSIILNHAADCASAKTRVERRFVVQRATAAIGQTKARFLRKINSGCQAHLAINKKLKGSMSTSSDNDDLFEIINDPEAIYQKVKLALRYAGGDGKNGTKQQTLDDATAKPTAVVVNIEQTLKEAKVAKKVSTRQMLEQQIDTIHSQRALVLPHQDSRIFAEQHRPSPMRQSVLSIPNPSASLPCNYHGHGGAGPLPLPSVPIRMPFAAMTPPAASFINMNGDSRTLQELTCLVALNHRRISERQHQAEEARSAVAGLLAQRDLQQLQVQRTAFLESLINNGNHDASRGASNGK